MVNFWISTPTIRVRLSLFAYYTKLAAKIINRGVIEFFGPRGFSNLFLNQSKNLNLIQIGFFSNYAFIMLSGLFMLNIFTDLYLNWFLSFKNLLLKTNKGI